MDIREQIAKEKAEALEIVNKAKAEGRGLNDEEKATTEKKFSRMNELNEVLKTESRFSSVVVPEAPASTVSDDAIKAIATASTFSREPMKQETNDEDNQLAEGVKHFARTGDVAKFALTTGTANGVLIPTDVAKPVVIRQPSNAIRRGQAAIGYPTLKSDTLENVNQPFFDDSPNIAITVTNLDTGVAGSESECNPCREVKPVVTLKPLNTNLYESEPIFYNKRLVNANTWDVTAVTYPMLLSRNERAEEAAWISTIRSTATVGVLTASPTAITPDEWHSFDESTPVAYDGLPAYYVTSKAGRLSLRGMKDGEGRYILDFDDGVYSLFGKPLFISSQLDGLTAGGIVALLIVGESVLIRDTNANELARYEGESAHPYQVGFEAFTNSGFNFGTAGVRMLKMQSSSLEKLHDNKPVVEAPKAEAVKAEVKK